MAGKKHIRPGEKLGLTLTQAQRSLLLDHLILIPEEVERAIRSTPPAEPLMFTLDDLDDLAGHVAAAANHAGSKSLESRLDTIYRKICRLLDAHTDEPETLHPTLLKVVSDEPGIGGQKPSRSVLTGVNDQTYPVKLTALQRASLIQSTRLPRRIKAKLQAAGEGAQVVEFTRKELEAMCEEVDASARFAPGPDRKRLVAVLGRLADLLDALDDQPRAGRVASEGSGLIYEFKVTLKDIEPPIWRRIQVPDGTLGELHEVLQVVFGWQDYHLHQFVVRGESYGPRPPDGMDLPMETEDEEEILLSQVVATGRKVRFIYEYDFGDDWHHEVVLERTLPPEPKVRYPRCVEGERACPPEDCGGPWGYASFLEAMSDPKHEDHHEMKAWIGGKFDPERFSVVAVNKELKRYS